jgi:SPP1 gp7 family putative phage head morphogenesis protein
MTYQTYHPNLPLLAICELGLKNQRLISRGLNHGLLQQATQLRQMDAQLYTLFLRHKAQGTSTHYIWRTRGDGKVRAAHAANNGRIFSWDHSPTTGHPGEDYNCRCVAEPYTGHVINDPPIEPVYPELFLFPLLRIGRGAIAAAISAVRFIRSTGRINGADKFTEHSAIRSAQRKITSQDVDSAIRTATETGKVTSKLGKYGTPQIHYQGTNGVTVIVETEGRNAGKVITFWRN